MTTEIYTGPFGLAACMPVATEIPRMALWLLTRENGTITFLYAETRSVAMSCFRDRYPGQILKGALWIASTSKRLKSGKKHKKQNGVTL